MEITKEQLLARLNEDLAWEYAALIQYVQHAAVITGPEYESILAELLVHANEEMQHAIAAAVHDATGTWFDRLPITPERVVMALSS